MKKRVEFGLDEGSGAKLTPEQEQEIAGEVVKNGVPVRFMRGGKSVDILTGKTTPKGTNVMYQMVYWNFTKDTAKKIAGWLGVKPVFSK